MELLQRRDLLKRTAFGCAALWTAGSAWPRWAASAEPSAEATAFAQATASATVAGYTFSKVQRWLRERALPQIDAETGLYRADGRWNYRDTAADCYPFLCWAAHLVDREALHGPVLQVLEAEQRLCNHIDRIPVRYDWDRKTKDTSVAYDDYVFEASEYVKDGLIAIVEAVGRGPWYERMKGIEEDLWKHARIDTPLGKIPSTNLEVNGEQLQALARLFTMTGDEQFLIWAERLADYYLQDEAFVPPRLRDHGCEIIGGLGLLLGVLSEAKPAKAEQYLPRLAKMFDEILARGVNADGVMFNTLGKPDSGLSDGWGYNYVGYLCWDLAARENRYRDRIAAALKNMLKPPYQDYPWEGKNIDGFADSIEGAIYLLNRVPVAEGREWVDREVANNVVRSSQPLETAELWGTMKLEANGVRTSIMHALMHTQGIIARPWRRDLRLGAARASDNSVAAVMTADAPWEGRLEFDIPRHRLWLGWQHDWARMNTLPEWFTVDPAGRYQLRSGTNPAELRTGAELHQGHAVSIMPGQPLQLMVSGT